MMQIDIAVPCYNYGRYLRDSVGSLLAQNIDGMRILIIDNASADDSVEVGQELARQHPQVEVIALARNLGQHASYNEAIDWAEAPYFMIFDADDVLAAGALARAIEVLRTDPHIAFAHGREVDMSFPAGVRPFVEPSQAACEWSIIEGAAFIACVCASGRNPVGATTVVRRTELQKRAGSYHRELDRAIDLNMWLRLAALGRVAGTREVQAVRRLHGGQLSSFYRDNPVRDCEALYANILHFLDHEGQLLPNAAQLRRQVSGSLSRSAARESLRALAHGRCGSALACARFAGRRLMERWWGAAAATSHGQRQPAAEA